MFDATHALATRAITLAALLALAITLSACGDDDSNQPIVGNQADAMFVNAMIPHHQGAIDMAKIAKVQSKREEVLNLAEAIITTQQAEIETLEQMKSDLPDTMSSMMDDNAMSQMHQDTADLEKADDFDSAFIAAMIPHHQSAIEMAEMVTNSGASPEVAKLAQAIIAAQTDEIEMMEKWSVDWYGSTPETGSADSMPHGDPGH